MDIKLQLVEGCSGGVLGRLALGALGMNWNGTCWCLLMGKAGPSGLAQLFADV